MSEAAIAPDLASLPIARRRHWGRAVAVVIILAMLALLGRAFAHGQIEWRFVGAFLTAPAILEGLVNTVVMAVLAMALGIVLGTIVAVMRSSTDPVLRRYRARLHLAVPRLAADPATAAVVQPGADLSHHRRCPGCSPFRTVDVMTPFVAALLGLGINQGAYTSEVIRGGMLAVDAGQYEAARSIGMTRMKSLRRIILPQAMRVVIPPLGNEFISMVKATSLASVIQYAEILHSAQNIYYANSRVIELLIVAGIWYVVVVSVLTPLQMLLERRFARGMAPSR